MNTASAIDQAINIVGLQHLAAGVGCSYQAIRKWQKQNRMPDTEYSGRTAHSVKIQELTAGKVTIRELLGEIPEYLK